MNIFHKVAWENLKGSRARTLVTIVGVALSAAMITAVATFGTSLLQFMINGAIAKSGDWHVAFPDVDGAFVQERAADDEVAGVTVWENIGYALLEDLQSPEKPYLFIAGFGDETFQTLPVTLISGRLPENDTELLIPSHVAIKGEVDIPVGSTLTLMVGERKAGVERLAQHDPYRAGEETLVSMSEQTYTVVGTYERPGFEEQSAPGYTAITKADLSGPADSYSLFAALRNPRHAWDYADSASEGKDYVLNEEILRFLGVSENRLFNTLLYSVGGIAIAIIMAGSVFLIYNSFHISVNERIRQFGILMSVGATRKQLLHSVLFEGLCISAVGVPVGILVGIGSIVLLLPVVTDNFSVMTNSQVPLTLSLSGWALLAAAAVSLITVLISAYLPARKAASLSVMDCIRQTNEIKTEAKAVRTSGLAQKLYGLEGTLALKNFKRNKKRYRSVVLSLSLSVVLFITGNAFGTTLKRLAKEFTVEIDGDISFYTETMTDDELLQLCDQVKTVDGVTDVTYQANVSYPCSVSGLPEEFVSAYRQAMGGDGADSVLETSLLVQFMEDEPYYDFIENLGLPAAEYAGEDAKVLGVALDSEEHTTFFTGSTMELALHDASGERTKTVDVTFVDNYPLDFLPVSEMQEHYLFLAVAPYLLKPQFDAFYSGELSCTRGLTIWSETPAQSMAQIQTMLTERGTAPGYSLINLSTTVDLFRSLNFVIDVFIYVFVGMLSLIGAANVFNTISTNIRLRRRELAMLRSVGMSDRAFGRMMNFECAIYGGRTLLYGLPIAWLLSWLIYKGLAMVERMDDFAFAFPWKSTALSVLGVFGIVFATMLYAAGRIRRENIIDALRDDVD